MSGKKTVNLIPRAIVKKTAGKKSAPGLFGQHKIIVTFFVLALIPAALFAKQMYEISIMEAKLAASKNKVQQTKASLNQTQSQSLQLEKQKSDLLKELATRKQSLDLLLSTTPGNQNYAGLLEALIGFMPQDVWLGQIVLTDGQIQLTGAALNPELIVQFTTQMDKSGSFKNSALGSSERQALGARTVYNFKVSAEPVWASLAGKK